MEIGFVKRSTYSQPSPTSTLALLMCVIAGVLIMMRCSWIGSAPASEMEGQTYLASTSPGEGQLSAAIVAHVASGVVGQATWGTPVTASANGGNQTNTATLPGVAGKTTWITGFNVTATGATAALDVSVTVTGVTGGTMTFTFNFPIGATVGASPLAVTFSPPIPASGQNTAIAVSLPAGGAGNTNAAVNAWGMQE